MARLEKGRLHDMRLKQNVEFYRLAGMALPYGIFYLSNEIKEKLLDKNLNENHEEKI